MTRSLIRNSFEKDAWFFGLRHRDETGVGLKASSTNREAPSDRGIRSVATSGHESEISRCGHLMRPSLSAQVSKPSVDTKLEKPHESASTVETRHNCPRGAGCTAKGDDQEVGNTGIDPTQPGWSWSADDVQAWSAAAADVLARTVLDGNTDPAIRRPSIQRLEAWRSEAWADDGADPAELLQEITDTVCAYPFGNAHARFSAWVNSPPHPLAAMSAGIAAALNPSVAGGNHAAVHLEHQVVRWFCDQLGWSMPAGPCVSG